MSSIRQVPLPKRPPFGVNRKDISVVSPFRVSAFSSLALHQMERIRVKYRPVGFSCSVPLVRNIPSLNCFPIRTASIAH